MKFFDSHAHYYDARFAEEYPGGADTLLPTLFAGEVGAVVNIGTSPETSHLAVSQAKKYKQMFTAIGIHPTDGQGLADPDAALSEIRALATDPSSKCVAIGEIGYDFHYPDTDREKQKYFFEKQLELAAELDLPVSVHDRDAHGETLDLLLSHRGVRGVLHSFSGNAEMATELVKIGYYVSFSGVLTFTNAKKTVLAAAAVPPDRILIETDCPYLAPHPLRGTLNHSGNLRYTCTRLAEILGMTVEEAARLTAQNACRFFGLSRDFCQ